MKPLWLRILDRMNSYVMNVPDTREPNIHEPLLSKEAREHHRANGARLLFSSYTGLSGCRPPYIYSPGGDELKVIWPDGGESVYRKDYDNPFYSSPSDKLYASWILETFPEELKRLDAGKFPGLIFVDESLPKEARYRDRRPDVYREGCIVRLEPVFTISNLHKILNAIGFSTETGFDAGRSGKPFFVHLEARP